MEGGADGLERERIGAEGFMKTCKKSHELTQGKGERKKCAGGGGGQPKRDLRGPRKPLKKVRRKARRERREGWDRHDHPGFPMLRSCGSRNPDLN